MVKRGDRVQPYIEALDPERRYPCYVHGCEWASLWTLNAVGIYGEARNACQEHATLMVKSVGNERLLARLREGSPWRNRGSWG